MDETKIKETVKGHILEKFLPDASADVIDDDTQLVTGGILDSLATLGLVSFLEENYGIKVEAHEVNVDNMNTLNSIVQFVRSKQDS